MSSSSKSEISLYIPTIKKSYSVDRVMNIFWKHGLGKIARIDFVPIMKTNKDAEPTECPNFKQAFLYIDTRSSWHPDILNSIEEKTQYKIYPNKDETFEHLRDTKEYWLIFKNNSPVPYATTTLNVHQLANNLALLEAQFAEREAQIAEREAQIAEREAQIAEREAQIADLESELAVKSALVTELTAVNTRLSEFNRDRTVDGDDDDENTEDIKAYNFVNSLDNVLHMMKKAHNEYNGYIESEEVDYDDHYEEYSRSDRFNEGEDDLDNEDDLDKDEECCDYCQMSKKIVLYNWRCEDGGLCEDCANLLTNNDEA
jgi:hypothetical protein